MQKNNALKEEIENINTDASSLSTKHKNIKLLELFEDVAVKFAERCMAGNVDPKDEFQYFLTNIYKQQ